MIQFYLILKVIWWWKYLYIFSNHCLHSKIVSILTLNHFNTTQYHTHSTCVPVQENVLLHPPSKSVFPHLIQNTLYPLLETIYFWKTKNVCVFYSYYATSYIDKRIFNTKKYFRRVIFITLQITPRHKLGIVAFLIVFEIIIMFLNTHILSRGINIWDISRWKWG